MWHAVFGRVQGPLCQSFDQTCCSPEVPEDDIEDQVKQPVLK